MRTPGAVSRDSSVASSPISAKKSWDSIPRAPCRRLRGYQFSQLRACCRERRVVASHDDLPLLMSEAPERKESRLRNQTLPGTLPIRIILGPQNDFFSPEAIETLTNNPYTVTPAVDRMGNTIRDKTNHETNIKNNVIINPKCTLNPSNNKGILPESLKALDFGKLKPLGSFHGPTTKKSKINSAT